mgnify:CR=1 FL=1
MGICTKSVINRKGFKRGKFSCKRKPSIQLYKGGKRRKKKTRKKVGGNYIGSVIHLDFNKNKMKDIILNYPDNTKLIQKYYVYHEDDNYLYLQDFPANEWKELM